MAWISTKTKVLFLLLIILVIFTCKFFSYLLYFYTLTAYFEIFGFTSMFAV